LARPNAIAMTQEEALQYLNWQGPLEEEALGDRLDERVFTLKNNLLRQTVIAQLFRKQLLELTRLQHASEAIFAPDSKVIVPPVAQQFVAQYPESLVDSKLEIGVIKLPVTSWRKVLSLGATASLLEFLRAYQHESSRVKLLLSSVNSFRWMRLAVILLVEVQQAYQMGYLEFFQPLLTKAEKDEQSPIEFNKTIKSAEQVDSGLLIKNMQLLGWEDTVGEEATNALVLKELTANPDKLALVSPILSEALRIAKLEAMKL